MEHGVVRRVELLVGKYLCGEGRVNEFNGSSL